MIKKILTLILLLSSISTFSQVWKTYPYAPTESLISFPVDEGKHSAEPIEWWYTTGHVVGATTGKHYSYMLTYFHYPLGFIDGFRILNISDDDAEIFYDDTQFLTYPTLAADKLDIQANLLSGTTETWKNKYDGAIILPFEYEINASSSDVTLDLDYNTTKRPLILGDDGYLLQADSNYTYYYSQTGIDVAGQITFEGVTENVTGSGWIDRQYGTLNPSLGTKYEWFSLQLSNNMDINLWNIFQGNSIPDDEKHKILAAYVDEEENTQYTVSDFELERLKYAYTTDGERCYAQKWHLTAATNNIDLIIETLYSDSEVQLPFKFYEGTTIITGTVDGVEVTGHGFAELLHTYEVPDLTITTTTPWNSTVPFTWELANPDDGNPLQYKLEVSNDGVDYTEMASALTETTYLWDNAAYADEETFWLKLTGYSVDGTITGEYIKVFTYNTSVGVVDHLLDKVCIYPNPTMETLHVEATNIIHIKIFDTKGMLIKTINNTQVNKPINTKNLSPGAYFVKVYTDKGVATKKIIIK